MCFKIGDIVVLTEEGRKHYWVPSSDFGVFFCVTSTYKDTLDVYAYQLNDEERFSHFLSSIYYRIATESEVKTYKLKNLFTK